MADEIVVITGEGNAPIIWPDILGDPNDNIALKAELDLKVKSSQVLTNVPLNALFTDTTYNVGDNGLTEKNFTAILKAKLDSIAANANNYVLPNNIVKYTGNTEDLNMGDHNVLGNDAIFDSMRLTNPNTPLSLGVTYVRQPRMFNLRSDAGAIIEFERDTEDFGCRQVLGANFYDFYTGATGSMSQRLRLGLTSSYFYNDLYVVGKLTNVSSIVSTGTIKANTNELVLTENITANMVMNNHSINSILNLVGNGSGDVSGFANITASALHALNGFTGTDAGGTFVDGIRTA